MLETHISLELLSTEEIILMKTFDSKDQILQLADIIKVGSLQKLKA